MEKIAIKRMPHTYDSNKAIRNLLNYIVREKSSGECVKYWGTRGLLKDIKSAVKTIEIMQKYLKKDFGRRIHHFVISFPAEIKEEQVVYIIAEAIADYLGAEYQLLYGVHTNTNNLHIHIAMNAVSYRSRLKWHVNAKEFDKWKKQLTKIAEDILKEYCVYS